ncbi:MAG: hypothetical protein HC802_04775 [Caldilineaceae bacterium]|nr:hypothetical protein [Caldilineaceae bacterium]
MMRQLICLLGLAVLIMLSGALPALAQTTRQNDKSRNVIYIPLLSNFESAATPLPPPTNAAQIFGQLGRLESALGRQFDSYFLTIDGHVYGIVGATRKWRWASYVCEI